MNTFVKVIALFVLVAVSIGPKKLLAQDNCNLVVELGEDLLLDFGDSIYLDAVFSQPLNSLASIDWRPMESIICATVDCALVLVKPQVSTCYEIELMDTSQCVASDKVCIAVKQSDILLYPNPVLNSLNIDSDGRAITAVEIYSVLGQLLYSFNNSDSGNSTFVKLEFPLLGMGTYFARISLGETFIVRKFNKVSN